MLMINGVDRTSKGSPEYVWALKDVNFEVKWGRCRIARGLGLTKN
jgi:hypothetical protein